VLKLATPAPLIVTLTPKLLCHINREGIFLFSASRQYAFLEVASMTVLQADVPCTAIDAPIRRLPSGISTFVIELSETAYLLYVCFKPLEKRTKTENVAGLTLQSHSKRLSYRYIDILHLPGALNFLSS
jgi:hypothetical protein